eukprot:jgi/Tetstr1/429532/TSEL_019437.t1
MNLLAPGDAHQRVQHDAITDAFRDHCVHDLGIDVRREVDDLFQQAVPLGNRDELKDLVPDAELSLPAFVVTGSYDPRSLKSTLPEFNKTMRYGIKYTVVPRATAVDLSERSMLGDIHGLAVRDAARHNTEPGQKGPLRDILDTSEYTAWSSAQWVSHTTAGAHPRDTRGTVRGSFTSPIFARRHTTAGAHPRDTRGTVRGSFTAAIFARRHTTAGAHPRVTRGTVRGSFTAAIFARRHTTAGAHPRDTRGTVRGSFTAAIFARRHTTAGAYPRDTRGTVRGSFTAAIFARRHTTAGAHPRVTRGTVRGSFTAAIFARRSALHGDDSACAPARIGVGRPANSTRLKT